MQAIVPDNAGPFHPSWILPVASMLLMIFAQFVSAGENVLP
jgi:hypothetical protein